MKKSFSTNAPFFRPVSCALSVHQKVHNQDHDNKTPSNNQNSLLNKTPPFSFLHLVLSLWRLSWGPHQNTLFPVRASKQPLPVTLSRAFLSAVASPSLRDKCQRTQARSWPCPNEEYQTQGSPACKRLANPASCSVALESCTASILGLGRLCVPMLPSPRIASPFGRWLLSSAIPSTWLLSLRFQGHHLISLAFYNLFDAGYLCPFPLLVR